MVWVIGSDEIFIVYIAFAGMMQLDTVIGYGWYNSSQITITNMNGGLMKIIWYDKIE